MLRNFKETLQVFLKSALQKVYPSISDSIEVILELPGDKIHGDFSTNVAMKSAKLLRKSPLDIAKEFVNVFEGDLKESNFKDRISKIEIKAPGFINFYITNNVIYGILEEVLSKESSYGSSNIGKAQKIQIEFVSANPTGPLSIAHARQAAVGDALGNILKYVGFSITKEFYVNDGGNQVFLLGQSMLCRAKEIFGQESAIPEGGYQGEYIKDIAQLYIDQNKIQGMDDLKKFSDKELSLFISGHILNIIKEELRDFHVHFDVWSHESVIATKKSLEDIIEFLKQKDFVFEKDGALWFKSTVFGDDKDRVIRKSDGTYTYLTPDIVYHKNKFDRGFERIINIWGPDHHGYIPRIKAAAQALGKSKDSLEVLIVQLATIFRDGQVLSMSTRRGQYISLREVMDEVGVDAARYFFLMRHISAHLEFDLDVAKKQTAENPVFYIQYAHARVYSINKKAQEFGFKMPKDKFLLLKESEELDLIKKLGQFEDMLGYCRDQLDPYPLVSYLLELATAFHRFYDACKIVDETNKALSQERLALSNGARIVLANGLKLLGVSTPESM